MFALGRGVVLQLLSRLDLPAWLCLVPFQGWLQPWKGSDLGTGRMMGG